MHGFRNLWTDQRELAFAVFPPCLISELLLAKKKASMMPLDLWESAKI